jgi:hypothetical protein
MGAGKRGKGNPAELPSIHKFSSPAQPIFHSELRPRRDLCRLGSSPNSEHLRQGDPLAYWLIASMICRSVRSAVDVPSRSAAGQRLD